MSSFEPAHPAEGSGLPPTYGPSAVVPSGAESSPASRPQPATLETGPSASIAPPISGQVTSTTNPPGYYAASASPPSMSASPSSSGAALVNQPTIIAGIAVSCAVALLALLAGVFLWLRRSRRRRRGVDGMVRIESRIDDQESGNSEEKKIWSTDVETPLSPASAHPDTARWATHREMASPHPSIPTTLPSYTSREDRRSRRSTTRDSSIWEDSSEIDVLATDGSSTIRTISTYNDDAHTPTLTQGDSPTTTLNGPASPAVNPFDHPGYTYAVGSANAARQRPVLSIDTSGICEPRSRTTAEHVREEYMRSQLALNPFDDTAAAGAWDEHYRSPAWSHGTQTRRSHAEMSSPWDEPGTVIGTDGSMRGRSRMIAPPTYSKLYSLGPQGIMTRELANDPS